MASRLFRNCLFSSLTMKMPSAKKFNCDVKMVLGITEINLNKAALLSIYPLLASDV